MNTNIMTKKEAIYIVNFMFYLFNVTFISAPIIFCILLYFGNSMFNSFAVSLALGVSLPTALFSLFVAIYPLVASKVRALFHKYSLPLIGLEKSSFAIIKLQNKFFTFLRNASISTIIFYILSILPYGKSAEFIYILTRLTLLFSIILLVVGMAIDGIYIYFRCLFEIIHQFYKSKNLDILLKSKFDDIMKRFDQIHADMLYEPKRLSQEKPSVSDSIWLLKHSIARRGQHRIRKTM